MPLLQTGLHPWLKAWVLCIFLSTKVLSADLKTDRVTSRSRRSLCSQHLNS